MLYLVKIEPNLFLIARKSVNPGMLEVPLQVPVGHFSFENQQAAGNGTGERRRTCIGEGGGQSFEGIGGGTGCLWDDNSLPEKEEAEISVGTEPPGMPSWWWTDMIGVLESGRL